MVIQVQHNTVYLKNCEGKAGTGLHASQVIWKRAAQEQLKSCEGVRSQGKQEGAKKPSTRGMTQSSIILRGVFRAPLLRMEERVLAVMRCQESG